MKLVSLELSNFRQHSDTSITFRDGLTGIIGPNGSGKSTLLEAIAWALYGAPAVRGNNDSIRSTSAPGGARATVVLTFELSGAVYRVTRSIDGAGRSGSAALEVDGVALRSGVSDVTTGVTRLLGMDYSAFFTSFFTGQKQLQFLATLTGGRERAAAISRMLGYERLTRARDQANDDRRGLDREIEGLERGLADPEELKQRKKEASATLARESALLENDERARAAAEEQVGKLRPLRELSEQKARRHDDLTRRMEADRRDLGLCRERLAVLRKETEAFAAKRAEFETISAKLQSLRQPAEELKRLEELRKHELDRQRIAGQISTCESEMRRLQARERALQAAPKEMMRVSTELEACEKALAQADSALQQARDATLAERHRLAATLEHLQAREKELVASRGQIVEAGEDGACPTCQRPLAQELPTVLSGFDRQLSEVRASVQATEAQIRSGSAEPAEVREQAEMRSKLADQVDETRDRKSAIEAKMRELETVRADLASAVEQLERHRQELALMPDGFDRDRYDELCRLKESLAPERERFAALRAELQRETEVAAEFERVESRVDSTQAAVDEALTSLDELQFSSEDHEKLGKEFENASAALTDAALALERRRGSVNTAGEVLRQVEREEEALRSRLDDLRQRRADRLALQTLAEALDALRRDLNDRIRPELETRASELLTMMTDGRYNVLEINDAFSAVIRDDGELKPVISGGEEDVVNLALRLAVSQMIADRAGQSFSLLVLDEVFGSLDDTRRDNVVALLQNLKNRFEQIILITHVDAVHDAVDNCTWVEFDEKQKTSRLIDRSGIEDESEVGGLFSAV